MNKPAYLNGLLVLGLLLCNALPAFGEDPFSNFFEQPETILSQDELVDMALAQNARSSIADIKLQQAEANKLMSESDLNAQVLWETDAGFVFTEQEDHDLDVNTDLHDRILKTKISLDKTLWDKSLTLGVTTAKKHIRTAQFNVMSEREEIRESVILADLEFQQAKAMLTVSRQNIQQLQALMNRVRYRQKLGYAARIDIIEAQTSLDRATTELTIEQAQLNLTRITLADLTGSTTPSYNASSSSQQTLLTHSRKLSPLPIILRNILRNNPELGSLKSAIIAEQYKLRQVNATNAPKLKLLSNLEQSWSDGDTNGRQTEFSIGLNFTKPLYTGGRQAAQVKRAKQQGNLAERNYLSLKRQLTHTARLAVAEYQSSLSTYQSLQRLNRQLKEQANLTEVGIKFGSKTDTDWVNTLSIKTDVEKNLLTQHYKLLKIKVKLAALQGTLGN